jgi:hypothetical protein
MARMTGLEPHTRGSTGLFHVSQPVYDAAAIGATAAEGRAFSEIVGRLKNGAAAFYSISGSS